MTGRRRALPAAGLLILAACAGAPPPPPPGWEARDGWAKNASARATAEVGVYAGPADGRIFTYDIGTGGEWVELNFPVSAMAEPPPEAPPPLVLEVAGEAPSDLEVKLVDRDGSVFWRKVDLRKGVRDWTRIVLRRESFAYAWGGDTVLGPLDHVALALSGGGKGWLRVRGMGWGPPDAVATLPPVGPIWDPNADAPGFGDVARRDPVLVEEENLVLEWLRLQQDLGSSDRALVPSLDLGDPVAHTFNNALVAMAFLVKGERARAERILDFYAARMDRANADTLLQNFYVRGRARGFFQSVYLGDSGPRPRYHSIGSDRWMGDMCWLLFAYKYHERLYGPGRYVAITRAIRDLLRSWFIDLGDGRGYVGHGWRADDSRLHEDHGHPEGNIDAYAAFRLTGDDALAGKIARWLQGPFAGPDLPLDLYTWRVLAFGPSDSPALDLVERDLRYRKRIALGETIVYGMYSFAEPDVENIWTDGTGHLAVAYAVAGDTYRANFYANQMDRMLFDWRRGNLRARALPYAARAAPPHYEWVDVTRGSPSAAAWYIFAKNRFNPMTGERIE